MILSIIWPLTQNETMAIRTPCPAVSFLAVAIAGTGSFHLGSQEWKARLEYIFFSGGAKQRMEVIVWKYASSVMSSSFQDLRIHYGSTWLRPQRTPSMSHSNPSKHTDWIAELSLSSVASYGDMI
jgi:hypothetical protein